MFKRVAWAALLLPFAVSTALAAPVASFTKLQEAGTEFGYDEVYGSISFALGRPFKIVSGQRVAYLNADRAVVEAMKSLASTLNTMFGKTSGSYIVTIQISKGQEVIARAPILSITSDVKKVLFFEKSREEVFALTQEQTLRDFIPVNQDNNRFMVKLEASHLESSSLDLGILKRLISLGGTLAGVETLPVAESATTVVNGVEGVLKEIFDTNKKELSANSIEMAFIGRDAGGRANATEIVIATKFDIDRENYTVNLPVRVNFNVQLTRLSARLLQDGTFDGVVPTSIIEVTPLIPGSAEPTLLGALRTSSNPKIRAFLDELTEKGQAKDRPAALGCRDLYKGLAKHLTQRDQAAFYYAFVRSYQPELKASQGGEGCMQEPMRSELTRWIRLPEGGLDILSTARPEVAVVPVGRDGNVVRPEDVGVVEKVLTETESLEVPAIPPGASMTVQPGTLPLIAVVPGPN
jgi:hypothetical protein